MVFLAKWMPREAYFTEFIREGVGVHAFNGEIFLQPVWDAETTQVFRTRFKAVSPKQVDTRGMPAETASFAQE